MNHFKDVAVFFISYNTDHSPFAFGLIVLEYPGYPDRQRTILIQLQLMLTLQKILHILSNQKAIRCHARYSYFTFQDVMLHRFSFNLTLFKRQLTFQTF